MGRKPKSDIIPGIYTRPGTKSLWFRYTVGGKQIRTSLETQDITKAIATAKRLRDGLGAVSVSDWDLAVSKYLAFKSREDDFTAKTSDTVEYALKCYRKYAKPTSTADISSESIKAFYEGLRKDDYAEATSQGYVAKVCAFARFLKIEVDRPKFKDEYRGNKKAISADAMMQLIDSATCPTLKTILMLGFGCGMRKDEIVNVRPQWLDLESSKIYVPGREGAWKTKSGRSRVVPMPTILKHHLQNELKGWEQWKYLVAPTAKGKRYRYDFRRPFEDHMRKMGYHDKVKVTPHIMRHSYATMLAEAGVGAVLIASWIGDRINTVEKHYIHAHSAPHGVIDDALMGITERDKNRQDVFEAASAAQGNPVEYEELDSLDTEVVDRLLSPPE